MRCGACSLNSAPQIEGRQGELFLATQIPICAELRRCSSTRATKMAKTFFFSASSVLAVDALLPKVWLLNAFHSAAKPEEVLARMGARCTKASTADVTPVSTGPADNASTTNASSLDGVPKPRPVVCEYGHLPASYLAHRLTRQSQIMYTFSRSVWAEWGRKVNTCEKIASRISSRFWIQREPYYSRPTTW